MIIVTMPALLRQMQVAYKEKLRKIRAKQIRQADENAAKAKYHWLAYLRARRLRRAALCKGMCNSCGYRPCACNAHPVRKLLIAILRRLAGINPRATTSETRTPETYGWMDGKNGPRGVSIPSWDNAVRAIEEDR